MGGSGRYPGTSIESSMWSGRYQVLQKYPEPDPEPGYLGSGRHRVARPDYNHYREKRVCEMRHLKNLK